MHVHIYIIPSTLFFFAQGRMRRLTSGSRSSSQWIRLYIYICVLICTQTCICIYTIPTPLSLSCTGAYAPASWHAG